MSLRVIVDGEEFPALESFLCRESISLLWLICQRLGLEIQWNRDDRCLEIDTPCPSVYEWLKERLNGNSDLKQGPEEYHPPPVDLIQATQALEENPVGAGDAGSRDLPLSSSGQVTDPREPESDVEPEHAHVEDGAMMNEEAKEPQDKKNGVATEKKPGARADVVVQHRSFSRSSGEHKVSRKTETSSRLSAADPEFLAKYRPG